MCTVFLGRCNLPIRLFMSVRRPDDCPCLHSRFFCLPMIPNLRPSHLQGPATTVCLAACHVAFLLVQQQAPEANHPNHSKTQESVCTLVDQQKASFTNHLKITCGCWAPARLASANTKTTIQARPTPPTKLLESRGHNFVPRPGNTSALLVTDCIAGVRNNL